MAISDNTPLAGGEPRLGRDVLPGGEVEEIQRARILSAMVELAAHHGYLGASVAPVAARADVSRRTFYELFDGREDCFLAAFELGVERARQVVLGAYESQRIWRDRVRHALAALLAFLDVEPELARVCVIEALGAGRLVLERRTEVLDELTTALDASAPRGARDAGGGPLLTAAGVVGGALSAIHGRLLLCSRGVCEAGEDACAAVAGNGGGGPSLTCPRFGELHGQLMALIALHYLGPSVAGEELTRGAPDVPLPESVRVAIEDRPWRDPPAGAQASGRLLERLDTLLPLRTHRTDSSP
jgi:AcrR family transcriptional regulator